MSRLIRNTLFGVCGRQIRKIHTFTSNLHLRIISDVHLEYRKAFKVIPILKNKNNDVTCCILAGDIGHPTSPEYRKFLKETKENFDHVLIIAGNHEYYKQGNNPNIDEINSHIRELCDDEKCIFLNQNCYSIGSINFVGCTLWSDIPKEDEYNTRFADFRYIKNFNVNKYLEKHKSDKAFIENIINKNPNRNHIVVTHHAPSYQMIPHKFYGQESNKFFASNLDYLFKDNVIAWISGHTHGSIHKMINNVINISNCVGYRREKGTHLKYKEDKILTVKL